MYIEAKETARLYKLLTEKLGNDTTEAMFKYIDNKTERSVEVTIKTLATKDDLTTVNLSLTEQIASVKYELRKDIGEIKSDTIKWMFIFWAGQLGAMIGIAMIFLKK